MADSKKKVSKKAASNNDVATGEPVTIKKKTAVKKKVTAKKESPTDAPVTDNASIEQETKSNVNEPINSRERAAASRQALVNQLRMDFHASKNALKAVTATTRQHLNLVIDATECEVAVIKEQITAALNRENSLISVGQKKAREILTTGESWSKQQLSKAKDSVEKFRKKIKK
ncbi:MAG: hypothetical protein JXA04_02770 [Gammaproteobacteria bacterium]|nr:hypothetical protein [Gammaproteobacteria bacterium]